MNRKAIVLLMLAFVLTLSQGALSVMASEGETAGCTIELVKEDGNGYNAKIKVEVWGYVPWSWDLAVQFPDDGGEWFFQTNDDGGASVETTHWFSDGLWSVRLNKLGCQSDTVQFGEVPAGTVAKPVQLPDTSNIYCQFARPSWFETGVTTVVERWNADAGTWEAIGYIGEAKDDGVFVNFRRHRADDRFYRVRPAYTQTGYIPFQYVGNNVVDNTHAWDLKHNCVIVNPS